MFYAARVAKGVPTFSGGGVQLSGGCLYIQDIPTTATDAIVCGSMFCEMCWGRCGGCLLKRGKTGRAVPRIVNTVARNHHTRTTRHDEGRYLHLVWFPGNPEIRLAWELDCYIVYALLSVCFGGFSCRTI